MDVESSRGSAKRKLDQYEDNGSIENEVDVLRKTVVKQKETIEDLYSELEEERNASCSAVNEYFAKMADIQREGRQFKRSSERKMAHHQKEILELKDELNKRKQAVQLLTTEVQSSTEDQQEILALKDELNKREQTIQSLTTEVQSYKDMAMQIQQETLAFKDELKKKEQAVQSLTTEVKCYKDRAMQTQQEILELKDELNKKEQTIQSLTAEVQYCKQQEDEEMLVPQSGLVEAPQPLVEGPQPLVEGPQPKEVAQTDNSSTVENQAVDEPQASRSMWTIENFSHVSQKKLYSDAFIVGGYKWRILIFPKGNNKDSLSMYLDVADSSELPYGWSRFAQFSLAVVNQIHDKDTIKKETQRQFNQRESNWGFSSFMPLSDLYDPNKGFLVNDTCILEADVAVGFIDYGKFDSKKETGYVGLKNQGTTSYLNSLLQTLYHIPYFRKAVYHMPTTENVMPSQSIPLALQYLFYKLQNGDTSVATKELTKSFGWDTYDSFMEHDVQELNRVLCEKLEDKMKRTVVEGTIQKLFEGHHMNYIKCNNVDYKCRRKESFYDLQLDVKGCRDVYASFDKYVGIERLEGDNKYQAKDHGLQDAKKAILFIDFPPVLQLQLKRFEYDFMRDTVVKINDRYEFPLELDLDSQNGKYLSPVADRSVRNLYKLHSVLVHGGGVHDGHYSAFIRPTLSDQWYKFDDERVTKEDMKRALEEQYGGEEELPQTNPGIKFTKYSNAYMLVYIRESDMDKIICDVDEKDIAEHLRIRLKKEQEEKEFKRHYTIIKVAREEDLREQVGKDIYFDLVDHDKVHSFRIQNQMTFNLFKDEVAKEFGIPVEFQRFWIRAKRQNHTFRPNRPLTPHEETQTVGQLRDAFPKTPNAELKLFLEVALGQDLRPIPPPVHTKKDILLFFKLYDPHKEELRYVGRLFVKRFGKPNGILTILNEMAGFASDEEIELFEEINFEPSVVCERLDKRASFRCSQIEDGDIICFQKRPKPETEQQLRFVDVPSYLEYVKNRQVQPEACESSTRQLAKRTKKANPKKKNNPSKKART